MHNHTLEPQSRPTIDGPDGPRSDGAGEPEPSHSMWWMVVCCAPMVLIALALLLDVFGPR